MAAAYVRVPTQNADTLSLSALQAKGYKVDYDEWHRSIHWSVIDYDLLIQPDPELRAVLQSIPLPKHIFTNADSRHAELALARLGIRDCFEVGTNS